MSGPELLDSAGLKVPGGMITAAPLSMFAVPVAYRLMRVKWREAIPPRMMV
jgi:multidrug efflux pump subunit AcrB